MADRPPEREPRPSWSADAWSVLPWNRHWPLLLPAVGRRLRWRWGRGPVSFRLESLSAVPGWAGRLRSVRVTVTDVDLDPDPGGDGKPVRLDEVRLEARDVRIRPSAVRIARVELQVRLGQAALDGMLDSGLPYASLQLAEGVGLARLISRPGWGHIELTPSVADGGLVLLPTALVTGAGARWTGPARLLPRLRIGADVLLPGSRLLSASIVEDQLLLTAELDDVTLPLLARSEEVVVDLRDATPRDGAVTVEGPGALRADVVTPERAGRDDI
jgi:hypothetical protein